MSTLPGASQSEALRGRLVDGVLGGLVTRRRVRAAVQGEEEDELNRDDLRAARA